MLAKEKTIDLPVPPIKLLISSLDHKDENVTFALETDYKDEYIQGARYFLDDLYGEWMPAHKACRGNDATTREKLLPEDIKEAKELLLDLIDAGPPPRRVLFNKVIHGLAKIGEMGEAMKLLKVMKNRGFTPNMYAYSAITSCYVKEGQMEEACKILDEIKNKHSKLSPDTYHTVNWGYCKNEECDKALAMELLREMEFGVAPSADEHNKLMQSLCPTAFDWRTTEKVVELMKECI
ncbi:small ribosomal subunit protein mS80 (rPPR6)-like [Nicotiana sylvestris]|uniref:Pentatricopeptide repeat-containing protein At3g02650, mitochondrial-like n=1 Tax=Nicotiana sylvestris TaxID=4096 RepID=A0A1U7X1V8_NICSY|nr:PREDICTED: pentatricopeptide repeat-containing protein At3g02650, mitochondrial-like [Nicotiana sylvestris]